MGALLFQFADIEGVADDLQGFEAANDPIDGFEVTFCTEAAEVREQVFADLSFHNEAGGEVAVDETTDRGQFLESIESGEGLLEIHAVHVVLDVEGRFGAVPGIVGPTHRQVASQGISAEAVQQYGPVLDEQVAVDVIHFDLVVQYFADGGVYGHVDVRRNQDGVDRIPGAGWLSGSSLAGSNHKLVEVHITGIQLDIPGQDTIFEEVIEDVVDGSAGGVVGVLEPAAELIDPEGIRGHVSGHVVFRKLVGFEKDLVEVGFDQKIKAIEQSCLHFLRRIRFRILRCIDGLLAGF